MQILHVNSWHVTQFQTDCGVYRRFSKEEWLVQKGTSWELVQDSKELEKEYQEILKEEPDLLD